MKSALYGAGAEYALHSLLNLAAQTGPASVRDLAAFQGISERYLAKLFTRLQKAGLVAASEGVAGGFVLAKSAARIRVLDVLDAVDPDRSLFACADIRRHCALFGQQPPGWATSGRCQIDSFMAHAERELRKVLASKTLADLGQELECKAPRGYGEASVLWFHQRKDRRITRRKNHESDQHNTKRQ